MDKKKIKILYISDNLRQRSGITSVIKNYLTHFDWNRVQIDLLVNETSEKQSVEQIKDMGADVFFMPVLGIKTIIPFFKFINSFFKQHRYDIVHSHYYQIDTLVFPIAKKLSGCKCISHSHSTKYSEYKLRSIRNHLLSWNISEVADVWAACSNDAGVFLFGKKFNISPKKLIVVNGIECKNYLFNNELRKEMREEFGIRDEEVVVGHIGRMAPLKNPLFVLEVFSELLKISDKYKLMMVGNGPMESEVKDKAEKLGLLGNICFTGLRGDVPRLINAFDIFLFPSLYEGLGIVAVEAQANGLNCVVSDTIPKEVNLTNITMLNLNKGSIYWANVINQMEFKRNNNNYNQVVQAGYDIQATADSLLNYYFSLMGY